MFINKILILIIFCYFTQVKCCAQAPIDILKNNNYKLIEYNSELLNSNIQFKKDSLLNIFLKNNKISELAYKNVYTNITFISSLIAFDIKNKKVIHDNQISGNFNDEDLDFLLIKIAKENIHYEDFINLKKKNTLGIFIYLDYTKTEMGYEIVELKGKKELLIKKEKINYLTLEKTDYYD